MNNSCISHCFMSLEMPIISKVAQSCPTLCNPMDCSLPGSSPWDFPGKRIGVGYHFLLQEIFQTKGSNPGLCHCRQTLYRLSHQGSPGNVNTTVINQSCRVAGMAGNTPCIYHIQIWLSYWTANLGANLVSMKDTHQFYYHGLSKQVYLFASN